MRWLTNFDKVVFESVLYDAEKDDMPYILKYADDISVNQIINKYKEKNDKCNNESKAQYIVNEELFKEMFPKEISYSYFCNKCRKFHPIGDYVKPIDGWDSFFEKYASEILAQKIIDEVDYSFKNFDSIICEILYDLHRDEFKSFPNIGFSLNDFETNEKGLVFKCPECGTMLPIKIEKRNINVNDGYKKIFVTKNNKWEMENKEYAYYEIFSDDNTPYVTLSSVDFSFLPNPRGRMHIKSINNRLTFNTKTGQAYSFVPRDLDTKKPVFERPRIANVTYSDKLHHFMTPDMANELIEKICTKKGIPVIKLDDIKSGANAFTKVRLVNKFGNYGKDFISCLITLSGFASYYDDITGIKKQFDELSKNDKKFQKKIIKENVKGKKRIKLYAKNPVLFLIEPTLKEMGFSNNDVLLNLCENANDIISLVCQIRNPFNGYSKIDFPDVKTFIKDYFSVRTEAELAKKIMADNYNMFIDTCSMFCYIKKKINLNKNELFKIFTGTITEMHNRVSQIYNALQDSEFYIPYYKGEEWYNGACGEYTFSLAKTSAEMKDVGIKMKICVGSYAYNAASKRCSIVFMKKNDELQACIEIGPDGTLIQAKDYLNYIVEDNKWVALKSFLDENKIKYEDCWDLPKEFFEVNSSSYIHSDNKDGYKIFETFEDMKKIPLNEERIIDGILIPAIPKIA